MPLTNSTNIYSNSRYVVDNVTAGAVYTTIQSAIDSAVADGGSAEIWIRQGTYTENLTLYDNINIIGPEESVAAIATVAGSHTPPATGSITFSRMSLSSATDVFSSAAAGTTTVHFHQCIFDCTNGYVCNLTNWTGDIEFDSCEDESTINGIVTNTGGSSIGIHYCDIGKGANVLTANGNVGIFGSNIWCPVLLNGTGTSSIQGGSLVHGNITTADTHTLTIGISGISTGAAQAITHNSTSLLTMNNVVVNSSNAPAIGGTGTIATMNVSFPDDYDTAATITEALTGVVKSEQMLAENIINMEDTGFEAWDAAGPYFDDTVLGTFDLLVAGYGYIKNERITWAAQSVNGMVAGSTYYIYIDDTGTIGLTNTRTDALYTDNIVLFECLRDSTAGTNNQITVKENNPYKFQASISNYISNVIGSVIKNRQGGANITLNGTQGIQINGADVLVNGSIETIIPDSAAAAVTFRKMFTLAGGAWATYNVTNTFLGVYNNAGAVTALGGAKYAVYKLYAIKDNLNAATPSYIAVIDSTQYNNSASALTAISNGTIASISGELQALEPVRLGYIVFSQSANTITSVIIDKQTLTSGSTSGGTNIASLVTTDTTNFNGWLSAADSNVQASLDTLDDVGLGVTPEHAVLLAGASYAIGATAVGATGEILIGNTGADASFSATPVVTSIHATTFDTNVAAAGLTVAGITLAADGTDANIDITMTPKGTGTVNPSALSVNSAYTFPTADGAADQVLTTDGAGVVTWEDGGGSGASGILVQEVSTSTSAQVTCTTVLPLDDTIPQSNEGDEVLTLAITPTSATNRLEIFFNTWAVGSASLIYSSALFQDATAGSLATVANYANTSIYENSALSHVVVAGTTSSTTFKVRIGPNGAASVYLNGNSVGRIFGGVSSTILTIKEYQV